MTSTNCIVLPKYNYYAIYIQAFILLMNYLIFSINAQVIVENWGRAACLSKLYVNALKNA